MSDKKLQRKIKRKQKEFYKTFKKLSQICEEMGWGDPHSYARGREIYAACALGHNVAKEYSGADAYDSDGKELEYKSTIAKNCKGAYTGISVKNTWEEQVKYLKEEKILKYTWHYYNRFENGQLVESWKMSGQKVYELLLPKIKKAFNKDSKSADPRLAASITWGEIKKHGTKIKLEEK